MSKEMKLMPELRFPEFENDGEWAENELGKICDVRDGTHDSPKYISDGYPLITSKNLLENGTMDFENVSYLTQIDYDKINQRSKVDIGDILFGMIGTIGNPVIVKRDGFAIKNVALIKTKGLLEQQYLIQLLKSNYIDIQFQKANAGGILKFIALGMIRKLIIPTPKKEEQQKIASCLSSLDELIAAHNDKLDALKDHKKGLLQNLFPQEGETVPKVRFPEFEGDSEWAEKKLSTLSKRVLTKNKIGKFTSVFTNSATNGIVDQRDYFDKDIANKKNLENYYVVENGDYVYNPRISEHAPVGPLSKNRLGKTGVMSPLYTVFRFKEKNNDFYEYYFQTSHWRNSIRAIANTGARFDRISITASLFMEIPVLYTSLKEQQKIASCLSAVDELITAQQEKIEELQQHKKGLMQGLFPKIEC